MRTLTIFIAPCFVMLAQVSLADVRSHCTSSEKIVWSCQAGVKVYSLCASSNLDRTNGYLQYRAGKPGAIELQYPARGKHPSDAFHFGLFPHGASLRFHNGGYEYNISEDLKGEPAILVSGLGKSGSVQCDKSTKSLTLNTTIELFTTAGVNDGHRE